MNFHAILNHSMHTLLRELKWFELQSTHATEPVHVCKKMFARRRITPQKIQAFFNDYRFIMSYCKMFVLKYFVNCIHVRTKHSDFQDSRGTSLRGENLEERFFFP